MQWGTISRFSEGRTVLLRSESLEPPKTRRPADASYVCFRRNPTHAPQQSEATRLRLHVSPLVVG